MARRAETGPTSTPSTSVPHSPTLSEQVAQSHPDSIDERILGPSQSSPAESIAIQANQNRNPFNTTRQDQDQARIAEMFAEPAKGAEASIVNDNSYHVIGTLRPKILPPDLVQRQMLSHVLDEKQMKNLPSAAKIEKLTLQGRLIEWTKYFLKNGIDPAFFNLDFQRIIPDRPPHQGEADNFTLTTLHDLDDKVKYGLATDEEIEAARLMHTPAGKQFERQIIERNHKELQKL